MRKSSYLLIVLLIAARSNAMQNQNSEELRQEAKKGHAEAMWLLATSYFDKGKYKKALKWINRYSIRACQDVACSKDLPVAVPSADFWWNNPEDQRKLLMVLPSQKAQRRLFLKDVEWIQKLTPDSLPEPTWIAKYGMQNSFMGTPISEIFIPINECKQKRQSILDLYAQLFKNR